MNNGMFYSTTNKIINVLSTVSTSIPVRQAYYGSPVNHSILLDDLLCAGNEDNLLTCPRQSSSVIGDTDCSHSEDAGVRCEGELKDIFLPALFSHRLLLLLCSIVYRLDCSANGG